MMSKPVGSAPNPWKEAIALVGETAPSDDSALEELRAEFVQAAATKPEPVHDGKHRSHDSTGEPDPEEDILAPYPMVIDEVFEDESQAEVKPAESVPEIVLKPIPPASTPTGIEDSVGGEKMAADDPMDCGYDFGDSDEEEEEEAKNEESSTDKGVDVRVLASILEESKAATANVVSGSSVILLLGGTGVGKSTFIQAISGRKIIRMFDPSTTHKFQYIVDGVGEPGFDIGHGMSSRTRHMRSYFRESANVFYIDSSGFGDTEGIETDIATSICVKDMASRCDKLRFVVLVNAYTFYINRATELRRMLELVANFVGHNFDEYKTSFTFLFTHCEQAFGTVHEDSPGISAEAASTAKLEMMRAKLDTLLNEAMKGTNDTRIRALISFMKKSLKKRFPFCDVFDPVVCNISEVVTNVEPRINPPHNAILEPGKHVRCSLTPSARINLDQELSSRVESIKSELIDRCINDDLKEEVLVVITVATHIEESICQKPATQIMELLSQALSELKDQVFVVVRRGLPLSPDADDGTFSTDEVTLARDAIEHIRFIEEILAQCYERLKVSNPHESGGTPHQHHDIFGALMDLLRQQDQWIQGEISKAHDSCMDNYGGDAPDFRGVSIRIRKLRVWAGVFKGPVHGIFIETKKKAMEGMIKTAAELVRFCNRAKLSDGPRVIHLVVLLKDLRDSDLLNCLVAGKHKGLSEYYSYWENVHSTASKSAMAILASITETVKEAAGRAFDGNPPSTTDGATILELPMLIDVVEQIQRELKDASLGRDFGDQHLRLKVLVITVSEFRHRCEICNRLIQKLDAHADQTGPLLQSCIGSLQAFLASLPTSFQKEGRYQQDLLALCRVLVNTLREVIGELRMLTSQLESSGIVGNPANHKRLLRLLASCAWFDSMSRESSMLSGEFVGAELNRANRMYNKYHDNLSKEVLGALNVCLGADASDILIIEHNTQFLAESCGRLQAAADIIGVDDSFPHTFAAGVQGWSKKQHDELAFPLEVEDLSFGRVHLVLLTAQRLKTIDNIADQYLDKVIQRVTAELQRYQTAVQETMNSKGNYEAKARILEASRRWSEFQYVELQLGSYSTMRQRVQQELVGHTKSLQNQLNGEGDAHVNIATIEDQLCGLRDATKHMNTHIGEAEQWVAAVTCVLETRKADLDDRFKEMIDAGDYRSIKAYLKEVKESKNPRTRDQYRKYVKVLSSHWAEMLSSVRAMATSPSVCLEKDAEVSSKKMRMLDEAQSELGSFVGKLPPATTTSGASMPWELAQEIVKAKQELLKALNNILHEAEKAAKKLDYTVAFQMMQQATVLHGVTSSFQSTSSFQRKQPKKTHFKRVQDLVSSLLAQVHEGIEQFLQAIKIDSAKPSQSVFSSTRRHQQQFPPDTSYIRNTLDKLRSSYDQPDCVQDIKTCYEDATATLSTGLNDLHRKIEAEVKERKFAWALKILGFLREELCSKGMSAHVKLNFNVVTSISDVTDQKVQYQRTMRLGMQDGKQIDNIAHRLDKLSRSYWNKADYQETCAYMNGFVNDIVNETNGMVRTLDFGGLRGCFVVLSYVQAKLQRHLHLDKDVVGRIKNELSSKISQLYDDMSTALRKGHIAHFQSLFDEVSSAMEDCPLVHYNSEHHGMRRNLVDWYDETCRRLQNNVHTMLAQVTRNAVGRFQSSMSNYEYGEAATAGKMLCDLGYFLASGFECYYRYVCGGRVDDNAAAVLALTREHFATGVFLDIGCSLACLRLPPTATASDIAKAYKKQSLRWHPDKNPDDPRATERFQRVTTAKESLEDERKLEFYKSFDFLFVENALFGLQRKLREETRTAIEANEFDWLQQLLVKLDDLAKVTSLLKNPGAVDVEGIRDGTLQAVKERSRALLNDITAAWEKQDFDELLHCYDHLESLERAFKSKKEVVPEPFTASVLRKLRGNLKVLRESVIDLHGRDENYALRHLTKFGMDLIKIGRIHVGFPHLKKDSATDIRVLLDGCHDEPWGVTFIFKLGLLIENGELSETEEDKHVGRVIVSSFPHFQDVRTMIFNREVITADVKDSIKKMTTEDLHKKKVHFSKDVLKREYDRYEALFNKYFMKYVQIGHNDLVPQVIELATRLGKCDVNNWNDTVKSRVTEITAGVFAAFTIIKSGDTFRRFDDREGSDHDIVAKNLLFTPHNIQVIAILRLLGIGKSDLVLPNHVMQIRTGEGKSIILGALAVVLALLGFSVRCVCYSEHLSERDNTLFKEIFAAFEVDSRIVYSKINTMSEDSVAAKGDIRQLTLDMVRGEARPSHTAKGVLPLVPACAGSPMNGKTILLVDEVDVFFGGDFYGKTYNQVAQLEHPAVEALLRRVWNNRKGEPNVRDVKSWHEYKVVVDQFKDWEFIVEFEVGAMCRDVANFDDPPYEVDGANCRIGYSMMDSVDWDLTYGYRTAFAFLREHEEGSLRRASKEMLSQALSLRISCGLFSYSNISPTRILGVSGTLEALSDTEKAIMEQFGVSTYTYVPSVYGHHNLSFDKHSRDCIMVDTDKARYFQSIANEINTAVTKGRSAIVFFETDERLVEFKKTSHWHDIRHGNILSANVISADKRNFIIKKAATSRQVTIATAAFGRGTDFFCKDKRLEDAGGMLVIQAFFSVEKSEEIQIQGRTARQGKKGSFCIVLLESDLQESLGIRAGECATESHRIYDFLDNRRTNVHSAALVEIAEKELESKEHDSISRAYLDALVTHNSRKSKRELEKIYEIVKKSSRQLKYCRMVCLSDATGSMSGIWGATKKFITEMLRRIDEIGEGQFELLWIAYRDYSDGDRLLEMSSWTKDPEELVSFVSNIECNGGGDYPEAVEWALKAVNDEHSKKPVTRTLLIADAPPHFETRGEILPTHGNRVMSTDYKTEAERLNRNGIPVHTFALNKESSLVTSFEEIASITGGESEDLDFSSDGTNKLIDAVCLTALDGIGGSELRAEYKARNWD